MKTVMVAAWRSGGAEQAMTAGHGISGPDALSGHGGGHAGHAHGVAVGADHRWLVAALALIVVYMGGEVAAGIVAHSLALLSDAAHMLTDAGSIVLALTVMRLAARPARGGYTFGLKRTEILSAQASGLTLLLLSVWLAYAAVCRLIAPPLVAGGLVVATAAVGIAVNVAAAWCIAKASRTSLNVEGAYQHILTDLYGFIATAAAGVVVLVTGFARADAIASLFVVALLVRAGAGLVRTTGRIFLEAAPANTDPDAIGDQLAAQPGVIEVHDLHIWEITSGQPAASAHVLVQPGHDCHATRRGLQDLLRDQYGIGHTTLQVDHLGQDTPQNLLHITGPGTAPAPARHCEDTHGPVHRPGPHQH
jgi:cobalt-zinc-cadmium efflux system protein